VSRPTRLALLSAALFVALALTAPSALALPREFFGITPAGGLSIDRDDLRKMESGDTGSLRLLISWGVLETAPDDLDDPDWDALDEIVGEAANRNIRVTPQVFGSPSWLRPSPVHPPINSARSKREWKEFLRELVGRYGPSGTLWTEDPDGVGPLEPPDRLPIRDWQVWNEQNSPTYWEPRPDAREYAKLVKLASAAIRGEDPRADIVLGGMFSTPRRPGAIHIDDFLHTFYKVAGIERAFDAVAIHPYSGDIEGIERQVKLVRDELRDSRDGGTGIRITELGWATDGPRGHPLVKTRRGQARMLRESFDLLLDGRRRWNIEQVVWYVWKDHDFDCTWCHSAGLFTRSLQAKPAWRQFKHFTP
jgi:hypothetical protein